jgi:sn-glycerol 3-phosphate transport system ATP-binding protein
VVETLGAERLVYCRLGETLFTVRIDGMLPAPRPGDRVPLEVAAERLHWFDTGTSQRVG